MRIMCVAVVLIVYISDSQEQGLHAGSGSQAKGHGEARGRVWTPRERKKLSVTKNVLYYERNAPPLRSNNTGAYLIRQQGSLQRSNVSSVKLSNSKTGAENGDDNLKNTNDSRSNSTRETLGKNTSYIPVFSTQTPKNAGERVPAHVDISKMYANGRREDSSAPRTNHKVPRMTRLPPPRRRRRRRKRWSQGKGRERGESVSSSRSRNMAVPSRVVTPSASADLAKRIRSANSEAPDGRQFVFDEDQALTDGTSEQDQSAPNLLTEQTTFRKVSLLILITFPPGVFLGYLTIAIIFVIRHRRCLCCLEGCELVCNKLLRLETASRPRHQLPRLSQVQISARHVAHHRRKPSLASSEDRKLLVGQFEEDRKAFQRTGKDPQLSSLDDLAGVKDSPSMTRKEWLRKRLKWWLANDRRRALSGLHSDPNGPPDEGPPHIVAWHDPHKKVSVKRSSSSDLTSVSSANMERMHKSRKDVDMDDSKSEVSSAETASVESETSTQSEEKDKEGD